MDLIPLLKHQLLLGSPKSPKYLDIVIEGHDVNLHTLHCGLQVYAFCILLRCACLGAIQDEQLNHGIAKKDEEENKLGIFIIVHQRVNAYEGSWSPTL